MAGTRTFHSKVGWVYWGVIAIFAAFLFFGFWDRSWVAILVCVAFEVWLIDEMVHTRYVITEEGFLVIESGRFFKPVAIEILQIAEVKKSKSLISSPALSTDRLKIVYRKKSFKSSMLVSPKSKEEFVRCLLKRNGEIQTDVLT